MPSFNNPILQLKGGVQMKLEMQLRQMEDRLFDLEGQLVVLVQTMPCSSEEECTLDKLQRREGKLIRWGEKL